jgi:hypothetical protein
MKAHLMILLSFTAICSCLIGSALAADVSETMHLCEPPVDSQEIYGIVFQANQAAQIRLMGDGSTILSFNVYDENGNVVISGLNRDDKEIVQWTPVEQGVFVVRVGPTGHSVLLTNGTCAQPGDPVARLSGRATNGEGF